MTSSPPPSNPPLQQERRRRARREDDLRLLQRDRELEAARRIAEALSQHIRVEDLVERALETAMGVVDAEAGSILLANPDTNELRFAHVKGAKSELLKGTAFSLDQGVAGWVFKKGQGVVVGDVKTDSRHWEGVDLRTGYATRDMIALPLKRWAGEPIGVMEILNKRTGALDEDDLAILTIISAIAADQIEKARLHEEARLAEVARLLGDISHDVKNLLMPRSRSAPRRYQSRRKEPLDAGRLRSRPPELRTQRALRYARAGPSPADCKQPPNLPGSARNGARRESAHPGSSPQHR